MADASAAAEEFGLSDAIPEGWRPEEGSTIIGKVIGLTKGWSDQSMSNYPIVIIHDEITDKDVAVHGFHYVLRDRLGSLRPAVGERIGIKMGPKVPLKSNPSQSVQTYTVKIDGRSEDIWSDLPSPRQQRQLSTDDIPSTPAGSDDDIPF